MEIGQSSGDWTVQWRLDSAGKNCFFKEEIQLQQFSFDDGEWVTAPQLVSGHAPHLWLWHDTYTLTLLVVTLPVPFKGE
jgi:hypothetical protein